MTKVVDQPFVENSVWISDTRCARHPGDPMIGQAWHHTNLPCAWCAAERAHGTTQVGWHAEFAAKVELDVDTLGFEGMGKIAFELTGLTWFHNTRQVGLPLGPAVDDVYNVSTKLVNYLVRNGVSWGDGWVWKLTVGDPRKSGAWRPPQRKELVIGG